MILQVLIAMIAGWINRHQQQVIAYLLEENRTLHSKLGGRRIRFTDAERRRLAALAFPIGRTRLKSLATLATPDTLMRWYKPLVAQKFDGSQKRNKLSFNTPPLRWAKFIRPWPTTGIIKTNSMRRSSGVGKR
jgi:hypothetical protein